MLLSGIYFVRFLGKKQIPAFTGMTNQYYTISRIPYYGSH